MKKIPRIGVFIIALICAIFATAEENVQFEEGKDYFSYQTPLSQRTRADHKIRIQFFFDYDCRTCSGAQDILTLYQQLNPNHVALEEYPVATDDNIFSARIFYTLKTLNATELSAALLFETAEKSRYTELAGLSKIRFWAQGKGIDGKRFMRAAYSPTVRQDITEAIALTEEYGVFTYPYVIIGGKYVLTASTLYNDDYAIAVLDFLINKIIKEQP